MGSIKLESFKATCSIIDNKDSVINIYLLIEIKTNYSGITICETF
jgi:hypothetical protein